MQLNEAIPRTMVNPETKKVLKAMAEAQEVPVAHVVRQALKEYLAKHRPAASIFNQSGKKEGGAV